MVADAVRFFDLRVEPDLSITIPATLGDPEHPASIKKVLVPPPTTRSDEIVAVMGGMLYRQESPGKPPFVGEGDHFEAGEPLYIIEVMKMFNIVRAPFPGTVIEILTHDHEGAVVQKRPAALPGSPRRAGRRGRRRGGRSRAAPRPHSPSPRAGRPDDAPGEALRGRAFRRIEAVIAVEALDAQGDELGVLERDGMRAASHDEELGAGDAVRELPGDVRGQEGIAVAGDDQGGHVDRREHVPGVVLAEGPEVAEEGVDVEAGDGGRELGEDGLVGGTADQPEAPHPGRRLAPADGTVGHGIEGPRTAEEIEERKDGGAGGAQGREGVERATPDAVDEDQAVGPTTEPAERLQDHLNAHAPAREPGALDALGAQDGLEVAHVVGDRVRAGVLRAGSLRGVEAAVVPAHEAVTVAEVVDLPAPDEGAAAEPAGEDDPRGAGMGASVTW